MSYVSLFLTWALIPFACPVLCRKSWIGQLANLHFVAVLESHHGLFVKLMNKFFGRPVAPLQDLEHEGRDEWLAVLQDELGEGAPCASDVAQPPSAAGRDADHDGDQAPPQGLPVLACLSRLFGHLT